MAAAAAASRPGEDGEAPTRQRSFFFVLTADQRTFLVPRFNEGERLSLRMLSLGAGARDEMHVLEAEGAHGVPLRLSQTGTKLYVQPSLPVVSLTGIRLTLPVNFRLTNGPGPLYVSGKRLLRDEEEEDDGAPVVVPVKKTPVPHIKLPVTKILVPQFMQPLKKVPEPHAAKGLETAKDGATSDQDWKRRKQSHQQRVPALPFTDRNRSPVSDATHSARTQGVRKAPNAFTAIVAAGSDRQALQPRRQRHRPRRSKPPQKALSVEEIKDRILVSVQNGVTLSNSLPRFQNFLSNCYGVMDPKCIQELWKWKQKLE